MAFVPASSTAASLALALVERLQRRLVDAMTEIGRAQAGADWPAFAPTSWLRDGGRHGGGTRWSASDAGQVFDRASVNVSQVHYDDEPARKLAAATALSAIIHPRNPYAPSLHTHVSWTETRDGSGYWRIMADLNPAIADGAATARFEAALKAAMPEHYDAAARQGARYFFIPALGRHRGVAHVYLEAWRTDDAGADRSLAGRVGDATIDVYASIVRDALATAPAPDEAARAAQLAYHTLYFFQVLTLDRGTTSGLLVHDQNDVGILGSLPSRIDRGLLASWRDGMPEAQRPLLDAMVEAVGNQPIVAVDERCKLALAATLRAFYRNHPQALEFQAAGDVAVPTVANHGG